MARGAEAATEQVLDPPSHLVDAESLDDVLEARLLAIAAIAVVALEHDDRLQHLDQLIRLDIGEPRSEAGEGGGALVGSTQAATNGEREALDPAVGHHRHDADVVGQHVDGVVAR